MIRINEEYAFNPEYIISIERHEQGFTYHLLNGDSPTLSDEDAKPLNIALNVMSPRMLELEQRWRSRDA